MKIRSLATLAVVLLILVVGVALLYAVRSQVPATVVSSTASASPAASPSNSPSPSASPALAPGTFENRILGYRITLPERYRLGGSRITPGQPPYLGDDTYTPQTEQQGRERCLSDSGDVGFLTYAREDVTVRVLRNLNGVSAEQWANTPEAPGGQPLSTHMKVVGDVERPPEVREASVEDNARAATAAFNWKSHQAMRSLHH